MATGWIWASRVHSSLNRRDGKTERETEIWQRVDQERKQDRQTGKPEQMFESDTKKNGRATNRLMMDEIKDKQKRERKKKKEKKWG